MLPAPFLSAKRFLLRTRGEDLFVSRSSKLLQSRPVLVPVHGLMDSFWRVYDSLGGRCLHSKIDGHSGHCYSSSRRWCGSDERREAARKREREPRSGHGVAVSDLESSRVRQRARIRARSVLPRIHSSPRNRSCRNTATVPFPRARGISLVTFPPSLIILSPPPTVSFRLCETVIGPIVSIGDYRRSRIWFLIWFSFRSNSFRCIWYRRGSSCTGSFARSINNLPSFRILSSVIPSLIAPYLALSRVSKCYY